MMNEQTTQQNNKKKKTTKTKKQIQKRKKNDLCHKNKPNLNKNKFLSVELNQMCGQLCIFLRIKRIKKQK